jgi:uncharacterized protein DUF3137
MTLVVLAVAAAIAGLFVSWARKRGDERQRELMLLCRHAGLDFAPLDILGDSSWLPFPMFGRERSGTENVVWDRVRGPQIRVFDFWYQESKDEGGYGPRRRLTCAVVPLPTSCPRLRVAPRVVGEDVREALDLQHEVSLELEDFNRRFVVESDDQRFAFAFLEQRMMEGLLALPDSVGADVNEDVLLLSGPRLRAEKVLRLYDAAVAISERIPRSLASQYPPRPTRGPHEERWFQGHWSEATDGAPNRP